MKTRHAIRSIALIGVAVAATGCSSPRQTDPAAATPVIDPTIAPDAGIGAMRDEAEALRPLVVTRAASALLDAVGTLPPARSTTVYTRPGGGYLSEAYTATQHATLDDTDREGLRAIEVDTLRYYHTFYGSPLASVRAFDIAAAHGLASFAGARVLDFGFGSVGQLRLLAACGADAVGTEVMPALSAIYADADPEGEAFGAGRVKMVFGRWPAEARVIDAVGTGFDLFVSKNTLKRGYVNPPVPVEARRRLDFGVEQAAFLSTLRDALKPGGLAIIYNLGGRPTNPDGSYNPMADIACPWDRAGLEAFGFEVEAFDADDSETARRYGAALGWDEGEGAMDLENGLFAQYTILRRPR